MNNGSVLQNVFLSKYRESSFIIRSKATVFLYFCLIMIALMVLLAVVFALLLTDIVIQAHVVIFTCLITVIISMVLLKKGNYYGAVNLLISIIAVAMIGGLLVKINRDAYAGYTTYVYFMLAVMVLATLFCRKRWLIGLSIAFLISDILFFFLVRDNLDPISYKAARVGVLDSGFTILITSIVSYMIIYITDHALLASERESEKNREQYGIIEKLLQSVMDTSKNLASSSVDLSETASSFTENSQNQASSAEEIMATVEEVSAGVENVTRGTREQYDRLESLIAKMVELSHTIRDMGIKINETLKITGDLSQLAVSGSGSLNAMNESMLKINESSSEMTGIVEIINTISDQINLLSLNATIEAARAGDTGRGFAVVADEISKLADQTATSIKEIDTLIKINTDEIDKGMQNVNNTVDTIGKIIEGVNSIGRMTNEIASLMRSQQEINEIVNEEANQTKTRSDEIKVATEEQKKAVNEIVISIASVNEITQSNALGAEKMLGSARSFQQTADMLHGKFDTFKKGMT